MADPAVVDFARASLVWETKSGSQGRWRVIATAFVWSEPTDEFERYVLAPMVMAGDVYGTGQLPHNPSFSYQMIASSHLHAIVREYPNDGTNRDSIAEHNESFKYLEIRTPALDKRSIDVSELNPDDVETVWPLTARIASSDVHGRRWLVDFPVGHINVARGGHFQVETGPVLLPRFAVDDADVSEFSCFVLAYVFFNRLDRVDLSLWGRAGAGRAYTHFGRLSDVAVELFRGG